LEAGTLSAFALGPNAGSVRRISDQIHKVGGDNPKVRLVYITYSSDASGAVRLPLFAVQPEKGGDELIVDNTGAVFRNFDHWRTANKLPPGVVFYPEGGHGAKLLSEYTPETPDTPGKKAVTALDYTALAGGHHRGRSGHSRYGRRCCRHHWNRCRDLGCGARWTSAVGAVRYRPIEQSV
jgi:hypothetical protein